MFVCFSMLATYTSSSFGILSLLDHVAVAICMYLCCHLVNVFTTCKFCRMCCLQIWRINTKYNVLYVHGPGTPGPMHSFARIHDTACQYRIEEMAETEPLPAMPTFYADDAAEPLPEELFEKDLFQFTEPSIVYSIEEEKKKIKKKTWVSVSVAWLTAVISTEWPKKWTLFDCTHL